MLERPLLRGSDVVDVRIVDVVQVSYAGDERRRPVAVLASREFRHSEVMIVLRGWVALSPHHCGSIQTCHQHIALFLIGKRDTFRSQDDGPHRPRRILVYHVMMKLRIVGLGWSDEGN